MKAFGSSSLKMGDQKKRYKERNYENVYANLFILSSLLIINFNNSEKQKKCDNLIHRVRRNEVNFEN